MHPTVLGTLQLWSWQLLLLRDAAVESQSTQTFALQIPAVHGLVSPTPATQCLLSATCVKARLSCLNRLVLSLLTAHCRQASPIALIEVLLQILQRGARIVISIVSQPPRAHQLMLPIAFLLISPSEVPQKSNSRSLYC
jgi:hypothetical protein